MVVQVDRAIASGQFERAIAPLAVPWREWMLRRRPQVPAARRRVWSALSGDDPGAFDVAATEIICRQPLAVDVDAEVFAADHKIVPLERAPDAVHDSVLERIGRRPEDGSGAQYRRRIDPQLRPVTQCDRADPAGRWWFQQRAATGLEMEKALWALPRVITSAPGDTDLLSGRVVRPGCRTGQIEAG